MSTTFSIYSATALYGIILIVYSQLLLPEELETTSLVAMILLTGLILYAWIRFYLEGEWR